MIDAKDMTRQKMLTEAKISKSFLENLNTEKIYSPIDWKNFFDNALDYTVDTVPDMKGSRIYNVSASFDIETSSFYVKNYQGELEKRAIMYEWSFGINGLVMIGRTWDEFLLVINNLIEYLKITPKRRIIIYIHNMAYEFQFMRKHFNWDKVFSLKSRKPVYAVTTDGIEFRCSYILSGYSLEKIGEHLQKYKVKKMVGDLDYNLIRHSNTPLSKKELDYCVNDVKVVMAYIMEKIESDGDISKILLTKTGYVRAYCRDMCMYEKGSHKKNVGKFQKYRRLINMLTLSPDEYLQLNRAFLGGFTHACAMYQGEIIENVGSFDLTSAYPATTVCEKFPMSPSKIVELHTLEDLDFYLHEYCCLFDVKFEGLRSTSMVEHYISKSRSRKVVNPLVDNGRIVSADSLITTITEQDFFIIKRFYEWDKMSVSQFRIYEKGYLPKNLILSILKLYGDKTRLKGVEGAEVEYLQSKEMINSVYGMMVTDICRNDIVYDGEWSEYEPDLDIVIDKYNKSVKRFLFYAWGVWITAYNRKNLFTAISEFGKDYIYSDTDSVKGVNYNNHLEYVKAYNDRVIRKTAKCLAFHDIPFEMSCPKTIEGKEKPIGVWDFEGVYDRFKTLGAKRYIVEKDGVVNITVSGLNKKHAVPYMKAKFKDKIFEAFDDGLSIPAVNDLPFDIFSDGKVITNPTGKNTHTYIDEEMHGVVEDYLGNISEYHELSGIHLEPAPYDGKISAEYAAYLLGIRESPID